MLGQGVRGGHLAEAWRVSHGVGVAFHARGEAEKASLTSFIGSLRPQPLPCAYLCCVVTVPLLSLDAISLVYGQLLIGLTLKYSCSPLPQLPLPVAFPFLPLLLPGLIVLPLSVLPLPPAPAACPPRLPCPRDQQQCLLCSVSNHVYCELGFHLSFLSPISICSDVDCHNIYMHFTRFLWFWKSKTYVSCSAPCFFFSFLYFLFSCSFLPLLRFFLLNALLSRLFSLFCYGEVSFGASICVELQGWRRHVSAKELQYLFVCIQLLILIHCFFDLCCILPLVK